MYELNRRAIDLPKGRLIDVLEKAIQEKQEILDERDSKYGKDRVRVHSYGENIYMPETFGFDMRDFYRDPDLAFEMELRNRLFWLDNSHDDGNSSVGVGMAGSMYCDLTLYGVQIDYTKDGVPNMKPHPLSEKADLSLIPPLDFENMGEMPLIHRNYKAVQRISQEYFGKGCEVGFPRMGRGPLDILIQLRGYENFVNDVYENPEFVHEALDFIVERRFEYNREADRFEGKQPAEGPKFSYIADDWVNFPFITKDMFYEFVLPAYRKIIEVEGPVATFHTCGNIEPIAGEMYDFFPALRNLDVSGWNDVELLDRLVPADKEFWVNFINTFVLTGKKEDHVKKLEVIREISKHRKLNMCAQAIVRLYPTLDETLERMNRFIDLAHEIFYQ